MNASFSVDCKQKCCIIYIICVYLFIFFAKVTKPQKQFANTDTNNPQNFGIWTKHKRSFRIQCIEVFLPVPSVLCYYCKCISQCDVKTVWLGLHAGKEKKTQSGPCCKDVLRQNRQM